MTDTSGSQTPATPQAGVAGALQDLTDQTRVLVRQEVDSALREMRDKAIQGGPAGALLMTSGLCGLCAAASAYRFSLRLLEKRLPPATAALTATIGYGAAAAGAGVLAVRWLREAPLPLPTETVRETGQSVAGAAEQAARQAHD
jgi:hypothetical protein